jgi:1-acyl-sn-glycerol-3-phosphate acyltransferase
VATNPQDRARRTNDAWTAGPVYAMVRATVRCLLWPYFRVRTTGREHIPVDGPVILAPVHRSNLDSFLLSPLTRRRLRALAKISLFERQPLAWFLASLGAFPVRRSGADRESMRVARDLLAEDDLLLVFPEGTRSDGPRIAELFDGTAWLAAKAGARVVPVGIAGSGEAMPAGAKFPKPLRIRLVVHPALEPPEPRAPRSALKAWTAELESSLQAALDEANAGI